MKYAAPILAVAAVAAARPEFTNNSYEGIEEGEPFTLTFTGCEGGCSIVLQNGPDDDLQDVTELTSSASGGSFTVTLEDLPTDTYAFKIINNDSGEDNYSEQFDLAGTGEPSETVTSGTATVTMTTSTAASSTTADDTTTVTTAEDTTTITTPSETSTETTTDEEETETTTSEEPTQTTDIPDPDDDEDAAGVLGTPMGLVAAAVAGLLLFQ